MCAARAAVKSAWLHFHARVAVFVPRARAGACPRGRVATEAHAKLRFAAILRPILWIGSFPKRPCASGCATESSRLGRSSRMPAVQRSGRGDRRRHAAVGDSGDLEVAGPLPSSTSDLARTTHPAARGGVLIPALMRSPRPRLDTCVRRLGSKGLYPVAGRIRAKVVGFRGSGSS